jgi:hypothetical protein
MSNEEEDTCHCCETPHDLAHPCVRDHVPIAHCRCEEEVTCMSYAEEDTCMSHEEEDTCR